jgi:hypothetical protein
MDYAIHSTLVNLNMNVGPLHFFGNLEATRESCDTTQQGNYDLFLWGLLQGFLPKLPHSMYYVN